MAPNKRNQDVESAERPRYLNRRPLDLDEKDMLSFHLRRRTHELVCIDYPTTTLDHSERSAQLPNTHHLSMDQPESLSVASTKPNEIEPMERPMGTTGRQKDSDNTDSPSIAQGKRLQAWPIPDQPASVLYRRLHVPINGPSMAPSRRPLEQPSPSLPPLQRNMCNVVSDWLGPTSYGINNNRLKCCCHGSNAKTQKHLPLTRIPFGRLPNLEVRALVAESDDLSRDIQKLESALGCHQKKVQKSGAGSGKQRRGDGEVTVLQGSGFSSCQAPPKKNSAKTSKILDQNEQHSLLESKTLRPKRPTDHLSPKVVPGPGTFRTGVPVNKSNTRRVYLTNEKSTNSASSTSQKKPAVLEETLVSGISEASLGVSATEETPAPLAFAAPLFTLDDEERKTPVKYRRKEKEVETWIDFLNENSDIFSEDDEHFSPVNSQFCEIQVRPSSPWSVHSPGAFGDAKDQQASTSAQGQYSLQPVNQLIGFSCDSEEALLNEPIDCENELFQRTFEVASEEFHNSDNTAIRTSISSTQHGSSLRGSKSAGTLLERASLSITSTDFRQNSAPHRSKDCEGSGLFQCEPEPEGLHHMRSHLDRDEPQLTRSTIRLARHDTAEEARGKVLNKMMKRLDIENRLKDCKVVEKEVKDTVNQSKQRSYRSQTMESANRNREVDRNNVNSDVNRSEKPQCDPEVALWLKELKLKDTNRYLQLFAEHEIDMESLMLITEEQLREIGIKAIGAFNKILIALQQLRKKRNEDEQKGRHGENGESEHRARVDLTLEGDSAEGDILRPRSLPKVQTNKTSLLRQTMREAKLRSDDVKRPWQNPNRNGTVRSKIDTGLRERSENDLVHTSRPPRPYAGAIPGYPPGRGNITARRSGQRPPLRAMASESGSYRQFIRSTEDLQSSRTELGSGQSRIQRPNSIEDQVPSPESWIGRDTHRAVVEVRPLGFEDGSSHQKLVVEYSDDSDSDVAPMRIEIRRRGSSPSRDDSCEKWPGASQPTDPSPGDDEEKDQVDGVSAMEEVEKEPDTARKKPPPVMAKPAMKQRMTLGVAQFGAHFNILPDNKDLSIIDDRKLRRSPETDTITKPPPPTSRKPSAYSTVSSRVDSTHDTQSRHGSATLAHLHSQLQELQFNMADDSAMEMIQQLQHQLEQLHQHISQPASPTDGKQQQHPTTSRRSSHDSQHEQQVSHKPEQPLCKPQSLVLSALQGNIRPKKHTLPSVEQDSLVSSQESYGQPCLPDAGRFRDSNSAGSSSSSKTSRAGSTKQALSNTMKKNEILKEVRKQKEDYRRQIKEIREHIKELKARHLESELTRIKHCDPLRRAEVPEDEVMFSDSNLIGEGAFSQVFRGSYHGSDVAIKRLKVPLDAQDKNYFTAEVSVLHDLRHPRVVLLLGVCTTTRLPLMVLEYLPKGSLYAYLHDTDFDPLDHVAYYQLARDMALGMNYLHEHRPSVLHLDLKSMNVLLTSHLRAKIADFGFSKLRYAASEAAHKADKKSGVKGTPAWMAPELLEAGDISCKTDVYSFGVILWEMFTRRHPYQAHSVFQVIEKVRSGKRPEIPKSCPAPLSLLINRSWNQNAGKRPPFREIIPMLERMHFPPEWRQLFMAAGIPQSVLEDVESTRTLVDIITTSLDQENLHIHMSETDSGRGVSVSPPDILAPCVTVVKALPDCNSESGVADRSRTSKTRDSPTMPSEFYLQSIEAVRTVNIPSTTSPSPRPPPPPPAPPLPPLPPTLPLVSQQLEPVESNQVSSNPMNFVEELSANIKRVKLKPIPEAAETHRTPVDKPDVPQGGCLFLKPEELAQQKQRLKPMENSPASVMSSEAGGFRLDPAALLQQKGRLRQTPAPEPSQLTDLSHLQPDKLSGLADVLRKAICGRRLHLKPDVTESIDQSATSLTWSVTDD